jgi:hypothetical protein
MGALCISVWHPNSNPEDLSMDDKLMRELVNELSSALEGLETQNLAVLEFLKAQKKGADKLAPYLEQAEKTSSVKWMATRARLNHLLDGAAREAERAAEKSAETQAKPAEAAAKIEKSSESENTKSNEAPSGQREKLEGREKTAELRKPEHTINDTASRTSEKTSSGKPKTAESTDNQADAKPSTEKQSGHATKSAA